MANFYEILGVDRNADQGAIRKAYLKLSLKHHPDKNPNNVEEAKAKFVEIGTAYETLSDPTKRAVYDRELRSGGGGRPSMPNFSSGFSSAGATYGGGSTSGAGGGKSAADAAREQAYDKFSDFFDATVAGMSEADLAAAMAGATLVGSVVGSLVGSRIMAGKRGAGGGGGILSTAGSLVGSAVASEMAASSVRAIHQKSIQRIEYKEACRRAVERGDPMPDPPPRSQWDAILEKTIETVKGVADVAMNNDGGGGGGGGGSAGNNVNGGGSRSQDGSRSSASLAGSLWKTAAAGVREMAKANMEAKTNATTKNGYR